MTTAAGSGIPAAAGSRIARPASRNSMVAEQTKPAGAAPATRSQIGVQTRAKAASAIPRTSMAAGSRPPSVIGNRPPSSLGGAAPTSGVPSLIRRPSVSAPQIASAASFPPSGASTGQEKQYAVRISQLETELATANETISSLQDSLVEAEITAASASAEVQSVRRQAGSEAEQALARAEAAEAAAEAAQDELADAKEDHVVELASVRKDFEEARASLTDRARDLEMRYSELERERDDLAGSREDLDRLLAEAQLNLASMPALEEECEDLETELAWHEEQLQKLEDEREEEKVAFQTIKRELEDADEVIAGLEHENESLRNEVTALKNDKEELLSKLQSTESREPVDPADANSQARLDRDALADRQQLAAELASADETCGTLIVILAETVQAHRRAHDSLASLHAAQAVNVERAAAARAVVEEELATVKERQDATAAQLSGALAQLDLHTQASAAAAVTEVDLASARETIAARENEVSDLTVRVSALERDLEQSDAVIADLHARFEQTVSATSGRPDEAALTQQLEEAMVDRDQAEEELHLAEAHIAELEAELDATRAAVAAGPSDDSSTSHIERGASREEIDTLHSSHTTRLQEVDDLQAQLATERTLTADARGEAKAVEEALMDARHQIGELEARVRSSEERVADLEAERESSQLKLAEIADLEESLDQAEQQLVSVTFELDDLRAQHDDLAQAALQDSAERQIQSDEHDELLELYNRRALELDSLRKILAETEAHAESLAWQLREKASAAGTLESAYEREREELLARIAQSEQEQDHLRSELDEAKHRLSDAQDALDHHAGADDSSASLDPVLPTDASGSPSPRSPGNLSMSLSPSADPVALLVRLREERDELRDRLDFARQEAKHRTDDLQDRLRRMDEVKAHEVSILQLDLMDKQAAYETEREMNDKLEQTVRELKEQRDRLGEDFEASRRLLRDAEATVQDLSNQLTDSQQRLDDSLAQAQDVAQLQDELSETSQAMASVRSAADAAQCELEEIQAALLEAQDERDVARQAVVEQEDLITALENRVTSLETEGTRNNSGSNSAPDPLADFASLCNAFPSDEQQRDLRIAELEATLRRHEERMALLQLNLAMRVALDDGDEEDMSREGPPDADATFVADPSEEVGAVRRELASVSREREVLLGRLQVTLDELDSALHDREATIRRTIELEDSLTDARAVAENRSHTLATAQAEINELTSRVTMQAEKAKQAEANAAKLASTIEQSERIAVAAQNDLSSMQVEAMHLRDELILAQAALAEASSAEQAAREEAARLAADLQDARTTLSTAVADQTQLQAAVAELQSRFTIAEEEVITLRRDLEQSKDDLSTCKGRLEEALREHAAALELHARTERAAAEATEQHSTASRRLAELDHNLELSCRENQTLRRLGQSSVAEAEALAAEVSTLKQQLEKAISAGQEELKAAHDQATRNLTEVITELEKREGGQAAAEEHARQLEAELEREKAQPRGPSAEDSARIVELEKMLEMRMLDVEEADEKLIEALKTQKKSAASVERLKAKVASLQRDLTAAKALQPALLAVPLPGAPTSPAAGRKRPAPSEFDVKPAPARAIAQAPSAAFDKENAGGNSARRQDKTLKSVKPTVTEILIKEHAVGAPRRDALARVDDNAANMRSADAPTDKIAALNARLQSFRRPKSAEIV